jgi:hypothetical protein
LDYTHVNKAKLPHGGTLVPVICMSDSTHLTNFAGDKKAWPIYMTIGNINSSSRGKPTEYASVLLGLLPVPRKLKKMNKKAKDVQRATNQEVLREAIKAILSPINQAAVRGMEVLCGDGLIRTCFPRIAAWLGDYPEYINILGLKSGACIWCEADADEFGTLEDRTKPATRRDHKEYCRLYRANDTSTLMTKNVRPIHNTLWDFEKLDIGKLPKPDLLHTIYIGVLKHAMEWLEGFLSKYHRMERFDGIWKSSPAYLDIPSPTKAYSEVSQWTGKEMR